MRRLVSARRLLCTASSSAQRTKATLSLPTTTFPLHPKHAVNEPVLAPRLADSHYKRQAELHAAEPPEAEFVLHDGPPYANGELHMGHFLNKTLKDMINRWMLLRGRRIRFTPGWDCHGLPIELRALQLAGATAAHTLPPLQILEQAAACALEAIEAQRASFMRWGIMGDWSRPYTTMQPEYEAAQLGVLEAMLGRGLIVRGERPVHWSPASRTALAEAELDYVDGHTSSAAYIAFSLLPSPSASATVTQQLEGASLVIWTTTPWTVPANQAVCASADLVYALVEVGGRVQSASDNATGDEAPGGAAGTPVEGRRLLVAEARVDALQEALGRQLSVRATLPGSQLAGHTCVHPLSSRHVPLLFGDHVTDTAGTGLVHTAPGHGPEDFALGSAHGLPAACPVDETGTFVPLTYEAAPFAGLFVLTEGNQAVLDALERNGALLCVSPYVHRYPYDWRSKTPVIFRTTPQWFVQLDELREEALAALADVSMLPASGRGRLEAFVRGRSEWCLSRQRSWGVPLPAFYHRQTGEALLTEETVAHVRALVAEHGSNCWWQMSESELLPPRLRGEAGVWAKGTDTLDVWFDSGTSWSAVTAPHERPRGAPLADLYLEGSDQHRGWFQSSLLTHAGARPAGGAPYGSILTHGFVVDERARRCPSPSATSSSPPSSSRGSRSRRRRQRAVRARQRAWRRRHRAARRPRR